LPENPDILETTRIILKRTHTTKKETSTEKERFFIANIVKGHKVTDLTRPNKLGTTTSKVATRSPGRTRLWKRLRAPSYNTAEDTQLRYTVFFERKDVVHPRRISVAQWDNTDQVRLTGISLPKPDVILDQTLICTG
jgi:hypothetical protein